MDSTEIFNIENDLRGNKQLEHEVWKKIYEMPHARTRGSGRR